MCQVFLSDVVSAFNQTPARGNYNLLLDGCGVYFDCLAVVVSVDWLTCRHFGTASGEKPCLYEPFRNQNLASLLC